MVGADGTVAAAGECTEDGGLRIQVEGICPAVIPQILKAGFVDHLRPVDLGVADLQRRFGLDGVGGLRSQGILADTGVGLGVALIQSGAVTNGAEA